MGITFKEYIDFINSRENKDYEGMRERFSNTEINIARISHAVDGIVTEAGEMKDALKKHIFYGTELDIVNLGEEAGDLFFYLGLLLDSLNITIEEVLEKNVKKLSNRYKKEFSTDQAINRNLEEERKILES